MINTKIMNREENIERINELTQIIFDDKGNVTLCGRDVCKELICRLGQVFEGVNFGDKESGFMNTEVIQEYLKRLN